MSAPHLSVTELKEALARGEQPLLLDVREEWEHELARLPGSTLIPLGVLHERADELDKDSPLVVLCHHGVRSQHAIGLLRSLGFTRLQNLTGGIDAYSAIDPSIPRY